MFQQQLIGRVQEQEVLKRVWESPKSEFVIVYGRRRIGKTFLINQYFHDRFTFRITGSGDTATAQQLKNFHKELIGLDPAQANVSQPKDWFDAFDRLAQAIPKSPQERKLLFIDELPWFDRRGSDFVPALAYFWNHWASVRSDIVLIGCGSAASWMLSRIVHNKTGLHNRVTQRIELKPFTLLETEQFLHHRGGVYDRHQLLMLYMCLGGIPYYLDLLFLNRSVHQNLDRLFFSAAGSLRTEYLDLYQSLFSNYQRHLVIVEALAAHPYGMSRVDLLKAVRLPDGGATTTSLNELEVSGFIRRVFPFGRSGRDAAYQLIDHFTLFYLIFVKDSKAMGDGTWLAISKHGAWSAWCGIAFEMICHLHIQSIKKALGINGVFTDASFWRSKAIEGGAQIDLVLDRDDHLINLCEIKFSEHPFTIDKAYAQRLQHKRMVFATETKNRKTLLTTLISASGVVENAYKTQAVQDVLDADAFFV